MKTLKKITPISLFFIASIAGILGFLAFAYFNNSVSTFDWLIMQHNSDYTLADYFYHIFYGRDLTTVYNAYDVDPCFPPLSYLLYHYMFVINPVDNMERLKDVIYYPYYLTIYLIFSSTLIALFCFSVQMFNESAKDKMKSMKTAEIMLLVIVAIFSAPFGASALERGNAVFIVLILLIFAMAFKDSDNKILREIALILIAVAANFKLYPAIFGLLYLKEKRYKEAFRLVIYGVALFVVPFVFFDGLKSVKDYLIILRLMQGRSSEQATTVRGLITSFFEMIGGEGYKWTGHTVGRIVENIYLVITLVAFWISKNKWKEMFLLVSPMVVYVASAYRYTAIYFFIALLMFLLMQNEIRGRIKSDAAENNFAKAFGKIEYVYAFLFAMIFTIPIWAYAFELENAMYLFIYIMIIMITIDTFVNEKDALHIRKK